MSHQGNGNGRPKGLPISNELARTLRTEAGMTLVKVGRRVGASAVAVGNWESGVNAPVGTNRQRYVRVLHAAAGFLLELTGSDEYAAARTALASELTTDRNELAAV